MKFNNTGLQFCRNVSTKVPLSEAVLEEATSPLSPAENQTCGKLTDQETFQNHFRYRTRAPCIGSAGLTIALPGRRLNLSFCCLWVLSCRWKAFSSVFPVSACVGPHSSGVPCGPDLTFLPVVDPPPSPTV